MFEVKKYETSARYAQQQMLLLLLLLLLLFLTSSVLVANPKKTTLHGCQSRSWSAEQGKENKRKSLAAYPPPPPTLLVRRKKIKSRDASTGATQVLVGLASVRPLGVASQNSTLPSAIIRFPVSLLLSSPGDV